MAQNQENIIANYLNRGILEANIKFAQNYDESMSVAKFYYVIDTADTFFFKDIMAFIHTFFDFAPIIQQPNDTFLILLRDCKLHKAKSLFSEFNKKFKHNFHFEIENIGITLLDKFDDSKSLIERLDKYFVMSKLSSRPKIFYGTKDFDFYETQDEKLVLKKIFEKIKTIRLHNFYQGLPILEEVKIESFKDGLIQIHIDPIKIPFYQKEKFTHIQHDLIPTTLKASIIKVETARFLMVLGKLEFLDTSAVERNYIRITPQRDIFASAIQENRKIFEGNILSISQDSVVLHVKINGISKLLENPLWNTEITLQFQIPTQKSFLTMIKTKAMIYSIVNEKVVCNIFPNTSSLAKIKNYISLRQKELIETLKKDIKRA
ncbi:MAG: hypothetical protein IBX44_03465 [Sulfurospirillum sp.]|nr:hypothetical protein [Sulfurospirillum sp.]